MKNGCVMDSNILIYHINEQLNECAEHLLTQALRQGSHISVISRIEVLGWPGHTESSLKATEDLLGRFAEHPLGSEIAGICIAIRQNYRIKLPDAIIAGTALYLDLPLMTRNIEDFKQISELTLIDPFEDQECLV
ncbi:type II toxin-antitoxin system VapC family toxin [Desulfonema magnum]|uniref:PIN domain-containing protein n=1 Tax=Desulfonema magnum TaxID=45655 RepID=A0A975GSM6_9BACT|nr:type II toxin-antitoxin system VapC family toxin [Desulfonema magnum]QTA92067.1 PIN domain-containing protein [Desulfonema magnum]